MFRFKDLFKNKRESPNSIPQKEVSSEKEYIKSVENNIKESFRKLFLSITKASEDFLFKEVGENYSIDIDSYSYHFKRVSPNLLLFELYSDYKTLKSFNIYLEAMEFNNKIFTKEASFTRVSGFTYQEYLVDLLDLEQKVDSLNIRFLDHLNIVQAANINL